MDDLTRGIPLQFDWVDSLLIGAGAPLCVFAGFLMDRLDVNTYAVTRVVYAAVFFGPIVLRRRVFGPPVLPVPRAGAMASFTSIIGLFGSLIGAALLAFGCIGLVHSMDKPPDFFAEAREKAATSPQDYVRISGEDPAITAARDAKTDAYMKAYYDKMAADDLAAFTATSKDARDTGSELLELGVVMMALGAFAAWYRYTGKTPSQSSSDGRGV